MFIYILKLILCAVIGYLLGNIAMGIPVAKLLGNVDIRKTGSNSAGATNVLRTLGWGPSLLTFLGDALKGVMAVLIGKWIGGVYGGYIGGIFVVLGHNWPAFYHFKGGKGVATSFGAVLMLNPMIALAMFVFQIIMVAITKYMSVASICSATLFIVLNAITKWGDWAEILFCAALGGLIIYTHRMNIKRLLSHSENRLDFGKINSISKK